ncbi:hypothetical protein ACZ87_02660 [Candidatus Erwinia dacicola]|uniref:Transposase n=1 Tax=Candidatus Erwinia dacicola TaxID=252393 RepID=A0A328TKB2_9GAMM|nr:hypothetical protein ACZ87_02660 [Candidatus Erwinia dacicola]
MVVSITMTKRYSSEVRKRAVNLVLETQHGHASQWKALQICCISVFKAPEGC